MKKLIKPLIFFMIVILGVASFVSCGKKTVKFEDGYAALSSTVNKVASLEYLTYDHNYYYDCYEQTYAPDIKKLFVFNESYEKFSYHGGDENGSATAIVYKQTNDYFTNLDYIKSASNLTMGKADDGKYYSFLKKDERIKENAQINSYTELYKAEENDAFENTIRQINTDYYYGFKLNELYELYNSRLGILELNSSTASFYEKKGLMYMSVSESKKQGEFNVSKTFNLQFDSEKIHFAEIIINTYDGGGLLVQKLWNKLTVKFKAGSAAMPKDIDDYITQDTPLRI